MKYDVLLICHDCDRGEVINSKHYSKLLDSTAEILSSLNLKCLSLALPFSKLYGEKTVSKTIAINKRIFFVRLIKKILKSINLFERVDFILEKFSLKEESIYLNIIKEKDIRLVIGIGINQYIAKACRRQNINVVEMLHGIGYSKIPWGWDKASFKILPTHIWSLDKKSTEVFQSLKYKGISVQEINHPWYSKFSYFTNDVNKYLNDFVKPSYLPQNKLIVLISLAWGYDRDEGPYKELINIIENGLIPKKLIESFKLDNNKIFWCIRRHPVQYTNKKYNHQIKLLDQICIENKNVEWRKTTNISLNKLLPFVDSHITMNSMTCYDAAHYGVKSLSLCPTLEKGSINEDMFSDLEVSGYLMKGAKTSSEILKFVLNAQRKEQFKLSEKTKEDFERLVFDIIKN